MRALIVCITLLFAFLTCTMAQIPSVKVENTKGAQVNTSSLVNHKTPMIISFWATTCKPCIRELDAINEQLPDWLEEANFRVVAVSTDDSRSTAKARALAEGHGWDDFIMLYDKNQEFMRYNPQIQISAESETKRSIFREKDKTKRSKKESAQHSKSRNKSFVMTSVSAL